MEVSRGCPHGCRFCSAGYIYRPPRFRSLDVLKDCLLQAAEHTHKIGLVGAAVSDLPHLSELCRHKLARRSFAHGPLTSYSLEPVDQAA